MEERKRNHNFVDKVGETAINKQGCKMTIIRYENNRDCNIEFEDGYIAKNVRYGAFTKGELRNPHYINSESGKILRPMGWWNVKENVLEEAAKYERKLDFTAKSNGAYEAAVRNGWLEECQKLMTGKIRWNYELVKTEALKYFKISDFQKYSASAYHWARNNKVFEELTSHMIPQGSLEERYIYIYTFPDNSVYIGLTCCPERREDDHLSDIGSSVYKYIEETGLNPIFEVISELLPATEASKKEDKLIKEYKANGFVILNKVKGGGLGKMKRKWTLETVTLESKKYSTKQEFREGSSGAYSVALKNKWVDIICLEMTPFRKPNGYWTEARLQEEANKYSSRKEFSNNSGAAYNKAHKAGLLEKICTHMKWKSTKPQKKNPQN